MQIETTQVKKLRITDIEQLDPVTVYLEETGPHSGKVIMEVFGTAWSYHWGGIGESRGGIANFFCSCDNHYLALKFAPQVDKTVIDDSALADHAMMHVVQRRREGGRSKEEARENIELISVTLLTSQPPIS